MKDTKGKARWDLLPWDLVEQTVDVLTFGADKYAPEAWRQEKSEDYFAALMRHIVAYRKGEIIDLESGKTHLAHAMCNLIFIHELENKR